jgi:hypothetical protein
LDYSNDNYILATTETVNKYKEHKIIHDTSQTFKSENELTIGEKGSILGNRLLTFLSNNKISIDVLDMEDIIFMDNKIRINGQYELTIEKLLETEDK